MIQIYLGNKLLDMPEKYNITFSLLNPAFSNDAFPRVFSTNFRIPRTPKNESAFEFGTRFDTEVLDKEYFASLSIEGMPFKIGYLKIEGYDDDNIEIFFKSDALFASDYYSETSIKDLVSETFTVPGDNTHLYFLRLSQQTGKYHWQIKIGDLVFEKIYDTNVMTLTQVAPDIVAAINNEFPGAAGISGVVVVRIDLTGYGFPKVEFEDFNTGTFTQMDAGTLHGPFVIRDLWQDYFTANTEAGNENIRFPVIRNDEFYDEKNGKWLKYINYHSGSHKTNTPHEKDTGFQYNLSPQIRNNFILERLAASFKYTPSGLYDDNDFAKLFLYNSIAIDRLEWSEPDRFSITSSTINRELNSYKYSFNINEHVPDISASEYLANFADFFNLFYIYKDGFLNIISRLNVLDTMPIDWTNKIDYDSYKVSLDAEGEYRIYFDEAKNDDYINSDIIIEVTNSEPKTSTKLEPPVYHSRFDFGDVPTAGTNDRRWKILKVRGKGNSEYHIGLDNEYGFRLFLYHGMVDDKLGGTITTIRPYPFGSSDSKDINNNTLGNLQLDLSSEEHSVFTKYWEKWLSFKEKQKAISFGSVLTINDILLLDWEQPLRYLIHENGMMTYIISKIDISVSETGINSSKTDGYTI